MASIATLRDLTEALIESSKELGKLDKVTADMGDFYHLVKSSEELRNILWSTTFELKERKSITADISAKRGYDGLTANFLNLIIELDKFKSLIKSEQTFMGKLFKASGRIKAQVTTASEAAEEEISRIKNALAKAVGQDVEVTTKVDPEILGGVIAKVEDKVYDGSIKTQLERIRGVLSES
jgi:F-type H+-transporting ATPase subunit delta